MTIREFLANSLHLEWVRAEHLDLIEEVLLAIQLIKHQVENLVQIEVLVGFQSQIEHHGLLSAVSAPDQRARGRSDLAILLVVWVNVHCDVVFRVFFSFEVAIFVRDHELADRDEALDNIVSQVLRLLTLVWMAKLDVVLRVFLERYAAVVLSHLVVAPVIEVAFAVLEQVRVPINVNTVKILED